MQGPKTASLDELSTLTDRIVAGLEQTPGIVDVDTHLSRGANPRCRSPSIASGPRTWASARRNSGSAVRLLVGGDKVTRYQEGGKQYDVRVRLPESDRNDPAQIEQLALRSRAGGIVQLSNVVRVVRDVGPTEIDH